MAAGGRGARDLTTEPRPGSILAAAAGCRAAGLQDAAPQRLGALPHAPPHAPQVRCCFYAYVPF